MFREVCVVYVSLSGEYMVSFVQSVEKSIMALQSGYVLGRSGSSYPQDEARRYSSMSLSHDRRTIVVVVICCLMIRMVVVLL